MSCKSFRENGGRELGGPYHPLGVLPQNWGGTAQKLTVTCLVLKATVNDKRTSSPLPRCTSSRLDKTMSDRRTLLVIPCTLTAKVLQSSDSTCCAVICKRHSRGVFSNKIMGAFIPLFFPNMLYRTLMSCLGLLEYQILPGHFQRQPQPALATPVLIDQGQQE
ncbi:hypothetical protein TNCV_605261 [Trichonephila clavipes]|nr:hypothetical protein TNCV_605261 [Trichonephila clavipes]